jgi:hypothetical protein
VQFVGVDGEGINEHYCLIQDSEGGEILNLKGLDTISVFDWLLLRNRQLYNIDPVFVGYVTTYDVNMILRDLDDETLSKIFTSDDKDFVKWKEYEILYIPRKIFKLRRIGEGDRKRVYTLFDVFTFFGGSFINACQGFLGSVPREIIAGKKQRSRFRRRDLPTIRRYNQLEVKWLVKLCDKLNEIFLSQNIVLKKWHGPGAVAEYVLGKRGMNAHQDYPVFKEWECPRGLWEAWDCAYYGGRFENMGIGTFQNVHSYDINSAYPFALSQLYKLDYGSNWIRKVRPKIQHGPQAVYLVEWSVPDSSPFGPFPWRDSQGRIFYPLNGLGWYWQPEVSAALAMFGNCIKLHEVWYQEIGGDSVFQKEIPKLYQLRNTLKRSNNPGEYAIKIALNSIYGKLAQRVGNSPFRCVPWAGWITSFSRSMLLRASMGRESSVLAFATDSVFSGTKLSLSCNSNLGFWKKERADKLLILMNGFYRLDDKTRKRKSATRGLPPVKDERTTEEDITWSDIIEGLNARQQYTYPFITFITHSMAIHFPRVHSANRLRFVRVEKTLRPFQGTRRMFAVDKLTNWETQNALSRPVRFPTLDLSYPSTLPFASVNIEEDEGE